MCDRQRKQVSQSTEACQVCGYLVADNLPLPSTCRANQEEREAIASATIASGAPPAGGRHRSAPPLWPSGHGGKVDLGRQNEITGDAGRGDLYDPPPTLCSREQGRTMT